MLSDLASEWAFPPRFSGQSAAFGNAHTWCKALQQGFVLKFRRRVMKMHVTCTATPRGMWTNVGQVSKPISAKVGVKGRSTWENAAAGGGGWGESGPNWCGNQKHGREASVGLMGGGSYRFLRRVFPARDCSVVGEKFHSSGQRFHQVRTKGQPCSCFLCSVCEVACVVMET